MVTPAGTYSECECKHGFPKIQDEKLRGTLLPPPLHFSPPSIFAASALVSGTPGARQGWFQRVVCASRFVWGAMAWDSLILALAVSTGEMRRWSPVQMGTCPVCGVRLPCGGSARTENSSFPLSHMCSGKRMQKPRY